MGKICLFDPVRSPIIIVVLHAAVLMCPRLIAQTNENQSFVIPVIFQFIHKIAGDPLEFDSIRYANEFGNSYSIVTLKYFISAVTLQQTNGESLELVKNRYIDASDVRTCTFTASERIPAGPFSNLSFIFGLDPQTNISGRFPNAPENRMEWPEFMGGGYHYMKLEGKIDSAGDIRNFQAHTGQLDGIARFIKVSLDSPSFLIDNKGVTITVVMDINEWWHAPHTIDLNTITSIMDNGSVQQQLMENGADVFSLGAIK